MVNLSSSQPSNPASVLGLARQFIRSLSAAAAGRHDLYRRETALDALQLVEPGLLGDERRPVDGRMTAMEDLARMTPAVVAASVFCNPRRGR
jgi:hypothetical protein